jgi:hypothetical protein
MSRLWQCLEGVLVCAQMVLCCTQHSEDVRIVRLPVVCLLSINLCPTISINIQVGRCRHVSSLAIQPLYMLTGSRLCDRNDFFAKLLRRCCVFADPVYHYIIESLMLIHSMSICLYLLYFLATLPLAPRLGIQDLHLPGI